MKRVEGESVIVSAAILYSTAGGQTPQLYGPLLIYPNSPPLTQHESLFQECWVPLYLLTWHKESLLSVFFYAVSFSSLPIKSYLSSNSSTKHHFSRKTMSPSQSLNIFLVRTLIAFIVWTMPHSIDYCSSDLMLVNLLISTLRTKRMIYIIFYTVGAQYY